MTDTPAAPPPPAPEVVAPATPEKENQSATAAPASEKRKRPIGEICLSVLRSLRANRDFNACFGGRSWEDADAAWGTDYLNEIVKPISLDDIRAKLGDESTAYTSLEAFAEDLQLVVSNCLQFNKDAEGDAWIRDLAAKFEARYKKLIEEATSPSPAPAAKKKPKSPSPEKKSPPKPTGSSTRSYAVVPGNEKITLSKQFELLEEHAKFK